MKMIVVGMLVSLLSTSQLNAWDWWWNKKKTIDDKRLELQRKQIDDPTNPYINYNMGVVQYKKNQFDDAAANFERAMQHSPDNPLFKKQVYFNLGQSYYRSSLQVVGPSWEKSKLSDDVIDKAVGLCEQSIKQFAAVLVLEAEHARAKKMKEEVELFQQKLLAKKYQQQNKKNDQSKNDQKDQDKKQQGSGQDGNDGQSQDDSQAGDSSQQDKKSGNNRQDKDKKSDGKNDQQDNGDQNKEQKDGDSANKNNKNNGDKKDEAKSDSNKKQPQVAPEDKAHEQKRDEEARSRGEAAAKEGEKKSEQQAQQKNEKGAEKLGDREDKNGLDKKDSNDPVANSAQEEAAAASASDNQESENVMGRVMDAQTKAVLDAVDQMEGNAQKRAMAYEFSKMGAKQRPAGSQKPW